MQLCFVNNFIIKYIALKLQFVMLMNVMLCIFAYILIDNQVNSHKIQFPFVWHCTIWSICIEKFSWQIKLINKYKLTLKLNIQYRRRQIQLPLHFLQLLILLIGKCILMFDNFSEKYQPKKANPDENKA